MIEPFTGDLVCWDFGDTLVDQNFMRQPCGIPGWTDAYDRVRARTDQGERWDVAQSTLRELAVLVADELRIPRAVAWRKLALNMTRGIRWFPESAALLEQLGDQDRPYLQAIVTVNPHEFWAMATETGLLDRVDCIVTSAEVHSLSKVDMANEARTMLDLDPGLRTTLLVDNMAHNIDDFVAAGGRGWHFDRESFTDDRDALFPQIA